MAQFFVRLGRMQRSCRMCEQQNLDRADMWSEKEMCSLKPWLWAEWAVSSEQVLILASCCLSPIRRNSVLDVRRVES